MRLKSEDKEQTNIRLGKFLDYAVKIKVFIFRVHKEKRLEFLFADKGRLVAWLPGYARVVSKKKEV